MTLLKKILALLLIIILLPVMIIIAITIKAVSKGAVIYTQQRVGQYGRTFTMYKFRTMPDNAEQYTGPVWASNQDSRPFAFGKFLRVMGLDELPQLFNILRGDMAFIGPRPERPFFVEKFYKQYSGYSNRHLVKPGIIGWAQVNGWRGDSSLTKRIEYDLYYVQNYSWLLDLKIITILIGKGLHIQNVQN
jgi:putative colanic acid biosynthesis UDP-glucose lipid carrier transferase